MAKKSKWYVKRTAPPDYPGYVNKKGLAYAHRINWWRATGQNPDGLIVHHKDHDHRNNHASNLAPMTAPDHARYHRPPVTYVDYICKHCKKGFRRGKRGKDHSFCSRRCTGLFYTAIGKGPRWNPGRTAKCGTVAGYRYCRCDLCKAAKAAYAREWRRR